MSRTPTVPPSSAFSGTHWIAGERRHASGAVFELRQRIPPYESLGSWPSGDLELVPEALAGARLALPDWRARTDEERVGVLARSLDGLRTDAAWRTHLAHYLGVRDDELAGELAELERIREALLATEWSGIAESGTAVVFARWSELVGELAGRVMGHLRRGRAVLVVGDERWPVGADVVGNALELAGIPPGLVAVIHGAREACRSAFVRADAPEAIRASGIQVDVGSGEPANRSYVVELAANTRECAWDVVRRSFGRAATLSGQRAGRVARVICHKNIVSSFTERLLEALAVDPDVNDPIPLVDGKAFALLRAEWELGLDEGATLIFGGEPFAGTESGRSSDRRVWPTVFTNVEPEMAVCRSLEPAPVLCLVRASGDAAAQSLARTLG